jgi:putative glutamine amidotransferase
MSMPLIGITCNQDVALNSPAMERLSVNYVEAVTAAGGLPVIIPTGFPLDELETLRQSLDGILLTGGGDIDPSRYRGKNHPRLVYVCSQRDELEIALTKLSIKTDWPLLGICRGIQVMNVTLHGTLYVNIPTHFPTSLDHDTPLDQGRDFIAHEVTIEPGTHLAGILGRDRIPVNSFHHQAAREIAPGLKVSARSTDKLVEGLELPDHRFFVGVQWHPECIQEYPEQQELFRAFVRAAQKK